MKRSSWLVFTWPVIIALLLVSCGQKLPETSSKVEDESETAVSAPVETHESKPASFTVSSLTISPAEVTSSSSVTIEVLVTNDGELAGTYDVSLKIDDTVESTETVTLEGGTSQKVAFTVKRSTAGTYSVSIDNQSGTFVVKARSASTVVEPPPPSLPDMDDFMKGFNYTDWNFTGKDRPPNVGPLYTTHYVDSTLKNLAATGTNWIVVLVNILQDTIASTEVTRDQYATPSDDALKHVIDQAHSLGMRVALNPNIQFNVEMNDPTQNHIYIGTAFTTEAQWKAWFTSYQEVIIHYATLAQDAGVDMFFIGSELGSTIHRETYWRHIAQEVRQVYDGPISYEALASPWPPPFSEDVRIKWWDAVDYIGVLGYYPLTNKNDPTVEELKETWSQRGWLKLLEDLSKKYQKPIIISEIGYLSADGTNTEPPNFQKFADAPLDLQEQADCYQAALEVLWGQPWLKGIFWWQWFSNPLWGPGGPTGKTEDINGKPALEIVKQYYLQK